MGGREKTAHDPGGGASPRHCASALTTSGVSGPPSRARAARHGRGTIAATSVAPEVRGSQVPQIPCAALRRWDDVVKGRAERMPSAKVEPDRSAPTTAQPAHGPSRAHDAEEPRVLGSAELLGIVWHRSPPGRPGSGSARPFPFHPGHRPLRGVRLLRDDRFDRRKHSRPIRHHREPDHTRDGRDHPRGGHAHVPGSVPSRRDVSHSVSLPSSNACPLMPSGHTRTTTTGTTSPTRASLPTCT